MSFGRSHQKHCGRSYCDGYQNSSQWSDRYVPGMSDVHVPNVLQRDFCATAPNQKWATDVTEFNVNGQKLYLSACMDLYNGEIIAYRMAKRPVFEMVSGTLRAALSRFECTAELIVHSDQGWHYKMRMRAANPC